MTIRERVDQVQDRLAAACHRAGRTRESVLLVAASKTVSAEAVREAMAAGITVFGENRVQEAAAKIGLVQTPPGIRWHMIGHLQRNKAKTAVGLFAMVESVDNPRLARELQRHAAAVERVLPVLLEINLGEEASKSGVATEDVVRVAEEIRGLDHLDLLGFMAIPPYTDDPEDARPYFARLRRLRDRAATAVGPLPELSMGMSHDFEQAILEGATIVRVGSAIFGGRTEG